MGAREANRPFRLGGWRVEPASGRLTRLGAGKDGGNGPDEVTLRPKVMELLVYLAARAGEVVSNDDLIAQVWKGVHVTDASLYYSVNQLRAALEDNKDEPEYIETLAKRGYRLVAEVVYEQVDSKAAGALELRTRLHHAALVFVAAVGFLFVFLAIPGGRAPDEETGPSNSLVVLPFVATGPDAEDGYLADGLTEEFINSLSKIKDLRVMGRTSSFYYKDKDKTPQEIGRELGVDHLLEGSVQRDGERLRVTAQLVETESGATLWSESYDGTLADIFSMQTEVASQVTRALRVTLLADEADALQHYGTQNAEARSLYLIALARLRRVPAVGNDLGMRAADMRSARRLLEEVVGMDPEFAEAWAALCRAYWAASAGPGDATGEILSIQAAYPLAQAALEKALALAPNLPEVRFANTIHIWNRANHISKDASDWHQARKALDELLASDENNPEILETYARFLFPWADYDRIIALYDRALALDPLSETRIARARALMEIGKYESARRELRRVGEIYPDAPWKAGIAEIEYQRGHFHHAILWSAELPTLAIRMLAWASMGEMDKAVDVVRLYGERGGPTEKVMEPITYYFRRDYAGLRDWLAAGRDSGATTLAPLLLHNHLRVAALFLRDWGSVQREAATRAALAPGLADIVKGTGSAKGVTGLVVPRFALDSAYHAYSLDRVGKPEEAAESWQWALELLRRIDQRNPYRAMQVEELRALIAAGRGEKEAALLAHERLYRMGWRHLMGSQPFGGRNDAGLGWYEDSPLLDSIRDEPRFIAVMDKIKADNAAMLAELNAGLTLDDIRDETFEDHPAPEAVSGN